MPQERNVLVLRFFGSWNLTSHVLHSDRLSDGPRGPRDSDRDPSRLSPAGPAGGPGDAAFSADCPGAKCPPAPRDAVAAAGIAAGLRRVDRISLCASLL